MSNLEFTIDWIDDGAIAGPELAATYASLGITVRDSVVTRVFDERSKTVRDTIHVPLYPLAEWLAFNWWFLSHEVGSPLKAGDAEFDARHALETAGEGYAFPRLEAVSQGDFVNLAWRSGRKQWTRVKFLEEGETRIRKETFLERCGWLIDRVVERLAESAIQDSPLQTEWAAIQAADEEETAFCCAAGGLGWDPYAPDDENRAMVLELGQALEGLDPEEAIAAIDPKNPGLDSRAIRNAVIHARRNSLSLERLAGLCRAARRDGGQDPARGRPASGDGGDRQATGANWHPRDEGNLLAQHLRRVLGLGSEPLPALAHIAEAIGEDPGELERVTRPIRFGAAVLVEGVVAWDDGGNAGFAFRAERDDAKRFLFCRALADVLTAYGQGTLITKARSDHQQRNWAFAAEFLAPFSGLSARVSSPFVAEEEILELAKEFGVSPFVIKRQIEDYDVAEVWLGG